MSQQSLTDVLDSFDTVIGNHIKDKLLEVGQKDTERDAERTRFKRAGGKDDLAPSSQAGPDERAAAEEVLTSKSALRASVAEFNTAADQKIAVIGAHGKAFAAAADDLERPKYRKLSDLSYDPDWKKRLATYPEAVQAHAGEAIRAIESVMAKARKSPMTFEEGDADSSLQGMLFTAMRDRVFRAGSYSTCDIKSLRRFWGAPLSHEWAVLKLTLLEERLIPYKSGGKTYMIFANDNVSDDEGPNDKEDAGADYSVTEDMLTLHMDRKAFPQDVPLLERWLGWQAQFEEYWGRHGIGGPRELQEQMKREGWYVGIPIDRVFHPFIARMKACHNLWLITGEERYRKNVQFMLPMVLRNFHTLTIKKGTRHPTAPYVYEEDTQIALWTYDAQDWTQLLMAEPRDKIKKTTVHQPKGVAGQAHMSVYSFLVMQQMRELYFDGLVDDVKLLQRISNTMTYSFFMGAPHDLTTRQKDGKWATKEAFCWQDLLGAVAQEWDEREIDGRTDNKKYWVTADDGYTFHPCFYQHGGFGRARSSVEGFPAAAGIPFAKSKRLETYLESIDTSNIPNEINLAIKGAMAFEGRAGA